MTFNEAKTKATKDLAEDKEALKHLLNQNTQVIVGKKTGG